MFLLQVCYDMFLMTSFLWQLFDAHRALIMSPSSSMSSAVLLRTRTSHSYIHTHTCVCVCVCVCVCLSVSLSLSLSVTYSHYRECFRHFFFVSRETTPARPLPEGLGSPCKKKPDKISEKSAPQIYARHNVTIQRTFQNVFQRICQLCVDVGVLAGQPKSESQCPT